MTRDDEVKLTVRQHFYHHGDTICHPKSGYVTTKLHGTSTCRYNNNAISLQTELFSSFLPSTYAGHVNLAAAKACSCQTGKIAALYLGRLGLLTEDMQDRNMNDFNGRKHVCQENRIRDKDL